MLDYARQRAIELIKIPRRAVLATNGPAGLQASEFSCEGAGLCLYLLVPGTSDHLFNLEHNHMVSLVTTGWEFVGEAQVISQNAAGLTLDLLREPGAEWCALVRVTPLRMQVRREGGWGSYETIDFDSQG